MSAMVDLDIKLSEYKLSDAQKNAVVEMLSDVEQLTAKRNTLTSLEKRGIIQSYAGGGWQFTDQFVKESGIFGEVLDNVDRQAVQLIQEIEEGLADWERELLYPTLNTSEEVSQEEMVQADTFDNSLPDAIKANMGFAATLEWRNTEVWDGLTAQEIREDLDTEQPVNRSARRKSVRAMNNARRRYYVGWLNNRGGSRKQAKICGGKA